MRKIFTLVCAALLGMTMSAEEICSASLNGIEKNENTTGIAQNGCTMSWSGISVISSGAPSADIVEISGQKFYKLSSNNSYVRLALDGDKFQADDVLSVTIAANQSKKVTVSLKSADGHKGNEVQVSDTQSGVTTLTIAASDIEEDGSIKIFRAGSSNLRVNSFSVSREISTDPTLSVNPEEVTLALTAAKPVDSVAVTFKGRNLEAGEYALTVPDLAGLSVKPATVTVGADGKLNQQVLIYYFIEEDVAEASTNISLKIGELESKVTVNYSAGFEKNYLSKSVNIEQWVLDNGKKNEDFKAVLADANIEFENINELDSLNDEKDLRNEPYLGLKLKKEGAFVACWLKQGDKIAVKFGALKDAVKIGVNGEYNELPAEGTTFIERTAEVDEYLEIIAKSDKTIVLKQIMLNEDIAEVVLPASPTEGFEDIEAGAKATKCIIDGQLFIIKNGVRYNALGAEVK